MKTHSACSACVAARLRRPRRPGRSRPRTSPRSTGFRRPRISADGRYVAYAVRTTDWDGEQGHQRAQDHRPQWRSVEAAGAAQRREGRPEPTLVADGRWLYFISGKVGIGAGLAVERRRLGSAAADRVPDRRRGVQASRPTCIRLSLPPTSTPTAGRSPAPRSATTPRPRKRAAGSRSSPARRATSMPISRTNSFRPVSRRPRSAGRPAEALAALEGFAADVPADGDIGDVALSNDGRTALFRRAATRRSTRQRQAFSRIYAVPPMDRRAPRVLVGSAGTAVRFADPFARRDAARLSGGDRAGRHLRPDRGDADGPEDRAALAKWRPALDADLQPARLVRGRPEPARDRIGARPGPAVPRSIPPAGHVTRLSQRWHGQRVSTVRGDSTAFVRESLGSPQQLFVQQGSGPHRAS